MWNISQYIAIYGPDILENIGIYWLILRYIRPVDTSPVYSNTFQYMPELIPGRNKSILEYIGVYCDILCTKVRLGYTAMYPNIFQYIPVFSSIQQYSAVFSSIQQYSAVFARLDFGDPVQQCCRKRVRRGTMGPEVASERQIDGSSSDGSMEEGPMLRLTASVCVLSAKWDRGGGCDGGCQVESMLLTVPVGATRARQTSA